MASYHEQLRRALTAKFIADGMDEAIAPTAAGLVADRVRLDPTGMVTTPVADTIKAVKAEHPSIFLAFTKPAEAPKPDTRSQLDRDMASARARAAADRLARADALAQAGNPWRANTRNLTAQGVISNINPALAARLKAEALA